MVTSRAIDFNEYRQRHMQTKPEGQEPILRDCEWLCFGLCREPRLPSVVRDDRFRTESCWENRSETDRIDVVAIDSTDGNGIGGIDRVPRC